MAKSLIFVDGRFCGQLQHFSAICLYCLQADSLFVWLFGWLVVLVKFRFFKVFFKDFLKLSSVLNCASSLCPPGGTNLSTPQTLLFHSHVKQALFTRSAHVRHVLSVRVACVGGGGAGGGGPTASWSREWGQNQWIRTFSICSGFVSECMLIFEYVYTV